MECGFLSLLGTVLFFVQMIRRCWFVQTQNALPLCRRASINDRWSEWLIPFMNRAQAGLSTYDITGLLNKHFKAYCQPALLNAGPVLHEHLVISPSWTKSIIIWVHVPSTTSNVAQSSKLLRLCLQFSTSTFCVLRCTWMHHGVLVPVCVKLRQTAEDRCKAEQILSTYSNILLHDCLWYKHLHAGVVGSLPRFIHQTERLPTFGTWRMLILDAMC